MTVIDLPFGIAQRDIRNFKGRAKWQRMLAMRKDWRRKKFKDQEGRCFYCNCAMMLDGGHPNQHNRCTLDHLEPVARGGVDHWENVVAACNRCNQRKGDMTADEFAQSILNSVRR